MNRVFVISKLSERFSVLLASQAMKTNANSLHLFGRPVHFTAFPILETVNNQG